MSCLLFLLSLITHSASEILGKQGKQSQIQSVSGFLQPSDFYNNYVIPGVPVLFKNAAKSFPAYQLWTDEYLSSFPESDSYVVDVEEGKKENRSMGSRQPSFKQFLNMYQTEDIYFVSEVPEFLRKDIPIYHSINCGFILDTLLIDLVMWFSSGGTTSVWHNDAYENINCLIKGEKTLILANKSELANIYLDISNGAYSSIDVDNVDEEKYPLLKNVEKFYNVSMKAGDCLYIPTRWFHYVRSFNRNIAINKWWHSHKSPVNCAEKSRHTTAQTLDVAGAGEEDDGPLYRLLLTNLYMSQHLYTHHTLPRHLFNDIVHTVLEDRGLVAGEYSIVEEIYNFITNLLGIQRQESNEAQLDMLFEELDNDRDGELSYTEMDRITDELLAKVLPKLEL